MSSLRADGKPRREQPALNPHLQLEALDPPRSPPYDQSLPPRRWRCRACKVEFASLEIADDVACPVIPNACTHCGSTPLCELDCLGIGLALESDAVHLVGFGGASQ